MEICNYDQIVGHQAKCRYRPQLCPAAKLEVENCDWTACYKDIKGHLKQNHLQKCIEYVEGGVHVLYSIDDPMRFYRFIFAHNEIFCISILNKNCMIHVTVLCIGHPENAAEFKYKMKFVNEGNTEGVTLMYPTRSSHEYLHEVYLSGNFEKLPYDVVYALKNGSGYVKTRVKIIRVGA
jgi:hypothetical protein